jgi:PiT family inorganic phosphate transporter
LASLLGFPISTTHSLVGALLGAGLVGSPASVNFRALGRSFVAPLVFSPLIAVAAGAGLYLLLHAMRLKLKIGKDRCICVGSGSESITIRAGALMAHTSKMEIATGSIEDCRQTYTGHFFGISAATLTDGIHFLSAGAVSFARGLNDTPKIAALLLLAPVVGIKWGLLAVGAAMAAGGLLNAQGVATTMSSKITEMNPGQGLCANLATSILVGMASYEGLPVSTTHVSVGALLGIGIATGQTKWKPVLNIFLSWIVTLPCAAALAGAAYASLRLLSVPM